MASTPRPRLTSVAGPWYRITRGGATTSLFWSETPADGRWQRDEVVRAVYLADSEETAWAEWMRAIAEAGIAPDAALPRAVFTLDADVTEIADLRDPRRLKRIAGVSKMQPTRRQWPQTQPVGEALWRMGARGIIASSAAHEGHVVLTLFRESETIPGLTERQPGTTHDAIPRIPTGLRT